MFFSYLQDVRFQRSTIHMCRTPKCMTTFWSFLVVRNCFENLSWYFLVKQETLAPVTSQRSNYCNFPWFILTFSGHVIPAENLLSVALDKGPAGKEFDFTFQSRDSPDLVRSIPLMLSCVHFSLTSLVHLGLKWIQPQKFVNFQRGRTEEPSRFKQRHIL